MESKKDGKPPIAPKPATTAAAETKEEPKAEVKVEEAKAPEIMEPLPAKDDTPISEKCDITIRLKPLGKGLSDSNDKGKSNKVFKGGDNDKHTVTFNDNKKHED